MSFSLLLDGIYGRLLMTYGPQGWWPGDGPFEIMVGAVLTQNTTWANAEKALENLRVAKALSPDAIRSLPELELAQLIRPCGYFNAKAHKLKALAEYLEHFEDDMARMARCEAKELRAELLCVYGIGPETADDIVLYVAGLPSFVIDTYTARIVARMGFAPNCHSYGALQSLFESSLPADAGTWGEYHALLDTHARVTCKKREPLCTGCCLKDLCETGHAVMGKASM